MKQAKVVLSNLSLYGLFFLLCLLSAFYFGNKTYTDLAPNGPIPITTFSEFLHLSGAQVVQLFGAADIASYVKSAQYFLQNGHFIVWMSNLWPPGQTLIIAGIFKIFGDSNYPLKMLYLTMAMWALAFFSVYHSLPRLKNPVVKIVVALLPCYFQVFRSWALGDGIVMSEGSSLPLLIVAVCLFLAWLRNNQMRYLIGSACVFAILAYFRGYFEIFGTILIVATLLYIAWKAFKVMMMQGDIKSIVTKRLHSIIVALLVFSVLLLPWRIYHFVQERSFSWQLMSPWTSFWSPDAYFATANIACEVQPDVCEILNKNTTENLKLTNGTYRGLTMMAFLSHPLKWYSIKAKSFNVFWFGEGEGNYAWQDLIKTHTVFFAEGVLILLMGLGSLVLSSFLWRRQLPEATKGLFIFAAAFTGFNFILFTFFHYEPRYSLDLQLFFVYLPLWLFFGFEKKEVLHVDNKL